MVQLGADFLVDTWYHMAATYSYEDGFAVYVDGCIVRKFTKDLHLSYSTPSEVPTKPTLGCAFYGATNIKHCSKETLDDFHFWFELKNDFFIWQLYNSYGHFGP